MSTQFQVSLLSGDEALQHVGALTVLLRDCVEIGASVGFVLPVSIATLDAFWRDKIVPEIYDRSRFLFAVTDADLIIGTVQLDCGTPLNQPHRAEVAKLLVAPKYRRKGIGRLLMVALESHAKDMGRTLLTLDTRTGDKAEPLYSALGYQVAGIIPGYCLDPSAGGLDSTTIMYKNL